MAPSLFQPKKTFYLSDFTSVRGHRIVLGNVFRSPFTIDDKAVDTLSKVSEADTKRLEALQQSVKSTHETARESRSKSWSAEVWAKFLSFLNLSFSTSNDSNALVVYEIDEMETVTLDDGMQAYIRKRILAEPELDAIVNGSEPRPIYMVIGIKYAKGMRIWIEEGSSTSGSAKGSGSVSETFPSSVGGGAQGEGKMNRKMAREIPEEVVFAYRLAGITNKKMKTVEGGGFLWSNDPSKDTEIQASEFEPDEKGVSAAAGIVGVNDDRYGLGVLESEEKDDQLSEQLAHLYYSPK